MRVTRETGLNERPKVKLLSYPSRVTPAPVLFTPRQKRPRSRLQRIVRHPALQALPFLLETPNDEAGYIREIHMVQDWMS